MVGCWPDWIFSGNNVFPESGERQFFITHFFFGWDIKSTTQLHKFSFLDIQMIFSYTHICLSQPLRLRWISSHREKKTYNIKSEGEKSHSDTHEIVTQNVKIVSTASKREMRKNGFSLLCCRTMRDLNKLCVVNAVLKSYSWCGMANKNWINCMANRTCNQWRE